MTISSRTPEGLPSRCPLCGAETNLLYSEPMGDATCPNCGCLVWNAQVWLERLRDRWAIYLKENFSADTPLSDLKVDSLDMVELVMELEEELDINIADEDAENIRTIGDLIRYLEKRQREQNED